VIHIAGLLHTYTLPGYYTHTHCCVTTHIHIAALLHTYTLLGYYTHTHCWVTTHIHIAGLLLEHVISDGTHWISDILD